MYITSPRAISSSETEDCELRPRRLESVSAASLARLRMKRGNRVNSSPYPNPSSNPYPNPYPNPNPNPNRYPNPYPNLNPNLNPISTVGYTHGGTAAWVSS